MTEPLITSLSEQDAIEQIVQTVQRAEPGKAPFALVLGAGFSHGLVPTVREIVEESLPQWMHAVTSGAEFGADEVGQLADLNRVIELLPDAPIEAAQALIGRAGIWRKTGESAKELNDYSYIIEQDETIHADVDDGCAPGRDRTGASR